jgi:hypothetical protein
MARRPQLDDDLAPIQRGAAPRHHRSGREAVHKLHHGVMAELKALGERAHRCRSLVLEPLDLQEQQVVLGFDPDRSGGILARAKKPANVVAKLGEGAIVDDRLAGRLRSCHDRSISLDRHI